MSEVEGVPQYKLNRLWKHMLKVEKLTGSRLRKNPRYESHECPIDRFSPSIDKEGNHFTGATKYATLEYDNKVYEIHPMSDSLWWGYLSYSIRTNIKFDSIEKLDSYLYQNAFLPLNCKFFFNSGLSYDPIIKKFSCTHNISWAINQSAYILAVLGFNPDAVFASITKYCFLFASQPTSKE